VSSEHNLIAVIAFCHVSHGVVWNFSYNYCGSIFYL